MHRLIVVGVSVPALAALCAGAARAQSGPVPLQNGTATYSQVLASCSTHSPDWAVNGSLADPGWAVATACSPGNTASSETAVWETVTDLTFDGLALDLYQLVGSQHLIGRFRFSVTTDDRSLFADGLDSGGDVSASWTVLQSPFVTGPAGMTFTTLADESVLVGGLIPGAAVYVVHYAGLHTAVTGLRLEVLEHPSLPHSGPGLQPTNGNLTLTELVVHATCMSVAHAGPDLAADEGTTVQLDGTASVVCGAATSLWSQVAGPAVMLDLLDPLRPIFVAPETPIGGATLTFQLALGSTTDTVDVTVRNVNRPPSALAGDDLGVAELSPVVLDGSNSFDPDDDQLVFTWTQTAGPAVDLVLIDPVRPSFTAPLVGPSGLTLTFQLTVDDGESLAQDEVSVLVENVNHDPTADAGEDQTQDEGTLVALSATASADPDHDALSYLWLQTAGPSVTLSDATGATPVFVAPQVGNGGAVVSFLLTVNDGLGGLDTDEVSVLVRDSAGGPECDRARPSLTELWPPNHKMVEVAILGVATPGSATISILGVTQDEPTSGLGNGDSAPDAVILGSTVLLRAERAGSGNGRVYRVRFRVSDSAGSCTGEVRVSVPHSRGRHAPGAIDDGQLFDSLQP